MFSINIGLHGRDVKFSTFHRNHLVVATFYPHGTPFNGRRTYGSLLILEAFQYSLINTIRFGSYEGHNECSWSKFYPNLHKSRKNLFCLETDHTNIFACAGHGTLRTYDTRVLNFINRVGFSENFSSCDRSKHNGNCIATADKFRNCIRVWDVRYTGNPYWVHHIETEPAKVIDTDSTLWKVKFSPYQEGQVASCSKDSEATLWNYGVGEPAIQSYFHHLGPVFGFDMSIGSDFSTLMANTGQDGFVRVWERMEVVPNF